MVIYNSEYKNNVIFTSIQLFAANLLYFSVNWILPVQISKDFKHD